MTATAAPQTPVSAQRCPLCGGPNDCAMALGQAGTDAGKSCWCVQAHFSAELLARVPEAARGRACICPRCAAQAKA
ncbi:MAG: hypothetical protein OHK0048_10370 [Rhodoferax sp.]